MLTPDKTKSGKHWLARRRYRGPVLAFFGVLALLVHLYGQFSWDLRIAHALQMYTVPRALGLMQIISLLGNGWNPYLVTAATVFGLLLCRWPAAAGGLLLSAGGSALLNTLLKLSIGRPRPTAQQVLVSDNFGFLSFPSGHVTFYVTYFGFLFLLAQDHLPLFRGRRAVLLGLALPVLLIGVSRVALGAHWPSDTLGAYLWGSVWLGLSWEIYQRRQQ